MPFPSLSVPRRGWVYLPLLLSVLVPAARGVDAARTASEWRLHHVAVSPADAVAYEQDLASRLPSTALADREVVIIVGHDRTYIELVDATVPRSGGTIVRGHLPTLEVGTPVLVGRWTTTADRTGRARARLTAWAREPERGVLESIGTDDAITFYSIAAGTDALSSGHAIADALMPRDGAPLVDDVEIDVGTVRHHTPSRDLEPHSPHAALQAPITSPIEPLRPLLGDETPPVDAIGTQVATAARESVRRAPVYDTGYRILDFPGGDPGGSVGSGVDVVIRALREVGIDLQAEIVADIRRAPAAYGAEGREIDTNIAHRRVRNLVTFLARHAETVDDDAALAIGDIVVWDVLDNDRPGHLGIVSRRDGATIWLIHHYRAEPPFTGVPSEDAVLDYWPRYARFRVDPTRLPQ